METLSFKRHEDNPLDSLSIGRVDERKKDAFMELLQDSIIRVQKILSDYDARYQGWDSTFNLISYTEDPFYGFRIKFTVSVFPFPSMEKIIMGHLDYTIKSGICRLSLHADQVSDQNMDKFGSFEETEEYLKYWLQQLPGRNGDRYEVKWI
jgi:hypothetical protein